MTTQDAEAIVASIDIATTEGLSLRALLLRAADGDESDEVGGPEDAAMDDAAGRWLIYPNCAIALTPLGREVAERLRPEPWHVRNTEPGGWHEVVCDGLPRWDSILCEQKARAEHIADLLTKADAEEAKRYRIG
jgi:hypothetical protein